MSSELDLEEYLNCILEYLQILLGLQQAPDNVGIDSRGSLEKMNKTINAEKHKITWCNIENS